jgi:hypothetical protein
MLFNSIEIHKEKIQNFTLSKDKSYKEQIEYYLNHLSILIQDYFPLKPMAYTIVEEYPDVIIVKKVEDDDINKYNINDLIFVNQNNK